VPFKKGRVHFPYLLKKNPAQVAMTGIQYHEPDILNDFTFIPRPESALG
jgi:hypothetical protein